MFIPVFISVRGARPGKNVQLTENEIRGLCLKSREIFLSQPILLELEAPLKICGECSKFCQTKPIFMHEIIVRRLFVIQAHIQLFLCRIYLLSATFDCFCFVYTLIMIGSCFQRLSFANYVKEIVCVCVCVLVVKFLYSISKGIED